MLDFLFNPLSVAVIGASNDAQKSGGRFLKSLIDHRFSGRIYPVNPKSSEVMGLKSYQSVQDIPGEVDLAISTIPAQITLEAVSDCAEKRVKFVIIHSAGFGELDAEGKALEARMVETARQGGTKIVGPNCMGLYSPDAKINMILPHLTAVDSPPENGAVAFIGQSGWSAESMIIEGLQRGLRFSKVASIGNQIDLTAADYLEYFAEDPQTKVITAYLEGIKEGRRLLSLARQVSKKKPIIIWKSGKTAAGARAAASHTGSLAVPDSILQAAFRQTGIIRADSIYEMIDFAVAFNATHLPPGRRVGILVEAGGGAVTAADACEDLDLEVPSFSGQAQEEIRQFMRQVKAPIPSTRNPVDLVWPPYGEFAQIIKRCIDIMSRECDVILWITYYPLDDENIASALAQIVAEAKIPLLAVPAYAVGQDNTLSIYTRKGMPAFSRPERAVKAIAALERFASLSSLKS
ncbi:MAG: CoA-binding protein [Deltaproteobacteria bacterium]|nr:CoA-binding protein [Deltaproteobacteria bacterium]MBW2087303.1 CoA-binding protein [Deltaproteobacteria bacterium]